MTVLVSVLLSVAAQTPQPAKPVSNQRRKMISTSNGRLLLDTLSIIPNTFRIIGVPDSLYTIDAVNAVINWKRKPLADSVMISYRVFPRKINAPVSRMKYDSIMNNFTGQPFIPDFGQTTREDNFFNFGNISYTGSFGRAISFGNSQDAVVTSNLNLQLSGYLADSIEIMAAITDNNIPIQPDGTTQQLNEFDKIFLQFRKKTWQLSLGDIDLRQQQSYFLSFYKRLQGIAFETTSQVTDKISNKTLVSGSIAKGKFTRNTLTPQEGNQGPYRLQGANNELYFIILANTERVYIDGELMQRGQDQDYVINYNTAEITFTAKRMVTKDKRIQVEFEYSDRNYLNSNIYLSNETNFDNKAKLRLAYFSNADAKSSPINQTLDTDQKRFLGSIGDSISQAYYPSATVDTFSVGKIMYKKIDTLYNSGTEHDSVFVYSTNPDSARYTLSFVDVGVGNGNYILDLNGANGKVYRWVEPVGGKKQGQYEPAVFLVTPKKQQVLNVGVDYTISKTTSVSVDGAMSKYDVNTFSKLDKDNDKGYAAKLVVKDARPLSSSKKLKLVSDLGYEYVQAAFKPLERLRNVEFSRDWGLTSTDTLQNESIITAATQLVDEKNNSFRYQFTQYNRGSVYSGFRNAITHQQVWRNWRFNNNVSLTNVSNTIEKGYFFRPTLDVQRSFPKLKNYTLGATYTVEYNKVKNKATDTLAAQSFSFSNLQLVLRSDAAKPNNWSVTWFTRTNAYPVGKNLERSDRSQNVNMSVNLMKNPHHQFRFTGTYRNLMVLDSSITSQKAEESLLARAEYQVNEWNGLLTGNMLYEAGAGQEQKRDFSYLEVQAGQGVYTWIDYNNDGVQQLNEFEVALFSDQAKYLRIFTPTNVYVKASYNTFNYSLALNPRAVFNPNKSGSFVRFLSKFNAQSSLQVNKKEVSNGLVELNPFKGAVNDTSLLTLSSIFVNTLSFNRFSTVWGIDINNTKNSSKSLLTYGYETYTITDWSLRGRMNVSRSLAFEATGKKGFTQLATSSEKFDNRNYKINQWSVEPKVTFIYGTSFRILTGYKFTDKKNEQGNQEKYQSNSVSTEVKYNILQSTSILGKFTFSNIDFKSPDGTTDVNSTSAYIMLDGLSPGRNYLWSLDLTKRLSGNLEMSIQYEGRKPGESRVVHVGRAALRAIL
ncbi:MAG: hypothetical protein QM731_27775 [Chitinophagaceae bacterium]